MTPIAHPLPSVTQKLDLQTSFHKNFFQELFRKSFALCCSLASRRRLKDYVGVDAAEAKRGTARLGRSKGSSLEGTIVPQQQRRQRRHIGTVKRWKHCQIAAAPHRLHIG